MVKKTFRVADMHCTNCVMKIESIEDELPAIKRVDASYVKQQMIVEYDETALTEEQIIAAVREKGYLATLAG